MMTAKYLLSMIDMALLSFLLTVLQLLYMVSVLAAPTKESSLGGTECRCWPFPYHTPPLGYLLVAAGFQNHWVSEQKGVWYKLLHSFHGANVLLS